MKLQNFDRSISEYELFPRAVRVGVKTDFTLRTLGMESLIRRGSRCLIRIIPHEENNSAVILEISDQNRYESIVPTVTGDGVLTFSHTFPREQVYTLRLYQEQEEKWVTKVDLRVYAAEEDLWARRPMRGNTHCHVCPSVDGNEDPALAAAMYRKAGFDYLAITDHHLIDGSLIAIRTLADLPHGIALYPGEEVHVPNAYIHAVNVGADFGGIGLNSWYNEHKEEAQADVNAIAEGLPGDLPAGVEPMDLAWRMWIAQKLHAQGGIAIVAHPFWIWEAHNTRNAMLRYLTQHHIFDAMEVLGGQEPGSMEANLQIAYWNDMRADGLFMPVVGCDDAHRRHYSWSYDSSFNKVYTLIFANDPSFDGFAEAIRGGYSAAVDLYDEATPHVVATYRLTQYAIFLLEQYYPIHDELCFTEGQLLWDAYLGDDTAAEMLGAAVRRVEAFDRKFFGRTE